MDEVIVAENLRKEYGTFRAVDGISFQVQRGECFGLLGPNGAGKTTTIRMLYGFTPKSAGALSVLGLDLDTNLRTIKGRLGVCQQENTLDPDLTIEQNLEVFARYFDIPKGESRRRADELLAFIALDHRRHAKIPELSGGMMRRLMLARALINNPEIVILDEPTTGLDPQSRHQVWDRLEVLKNRGLSILLTTHYMDEAARLCDRLVIIDHGRILVEGEPRALIRRHVGDHLIEIVDPTDRLCTYIKNERLEHENLGYRMIVYAQEQGLYAKICSLGAQGCSLRQATLEDVFLRLTGRELRE